MSYTINFKASTCFLTILYLSIVVHFLGGGVYRGEKENCHDQSSSSKLMYYARKKRHTGYIAKKNQAIPLQNVHSVKKFEYLYPNVQWTIALLLAWKGIDFPFFPSYSFFWVVNFKYCHSSFYYNWASLSLIANIVCSNQFKHTM